MTNKEQILAFYQAVYNERKDPAAFCTADFTEHYTGETKLADGVAGFVERYAAFWAVDGATVEVIKIAQEDEKVAAYVKLKRPTGETFIRAVDIFHMRDGKICWHTSTVQPVA